MLVWLNLLQKWHNHLGQDAKVYYTYGTSLSIIHIRAVISVAHYTDFDKDSEGVTQWNRSA